MEAPFVELTNQFELMSDPMDGSAPGFSSVQNPVGDAVVG